jgi:O-antigen/teichoic acid export membrane protein
MHLFPALGGSDDRSGSVNIIQRTILVAIALIVPIVIVLFAFRPLVLEIVYKEDFLIAVDYFGAMLVIGIPKVVSWILGLAMLPLGLKREWFISGLVLIVVYAAGIWMSLLSGFGIYAIPAAYGAGLLCQAIYTVVVYRNNSMRIGRVFGAQMAVYLIMTCLLAIAVLWQAALLGVVILYLWFVYHYRLFTEIKERWDAFRRNIPA